MRFQADAMLGHRDSGNNLCRIRANFRKAAPPAARKFPRARYNCKAWPASVVKAYSWPTGEVAVGEGDTRAIVRELYDAYGRRDFERVAALIHDDIDWVIYAPMSVFPFAGPRHGRAAVLAAMAAIAKTFALESYQPDV